MCYNTKIMKPKSITFVTQYYRSPTPLKDEYIDIKNNTKIKNKLDIKAKSFLVLKKVIK